MARPKRGHPYPVEEVTTRKTTFLRSPHSLYLVERPKEPSSIFDMRSCEGGVDLEMFDKDRPGRELPTIEEVEEIESVPMIKVGSYEDQDLTELRGPPEEKPDVQEIELVNQSDVGGEKDIEVPVEDPIGQKTEKGEKGGEVQMKEEQPKLGRGMRTKFLRKLD